MVTSDHIIIQVAEHEGHNDMHKTVLDIVHVCTYNKTFLFRALSHATQGWLELNQEYLLLVELHSYN